MKTKEFLKRVKELGFEARTEFGLKGEFIEIRIGDAGRIAGQSHFL